MPPHDSLPDISPFYEVEVWCTFTRRWVPGFWLDGLEPDGSIRLRRGIDQAPLSGPVPASSVRTRQSSPGRVIDLRQSDRADRSTSGRSTSGHPTVAHPAAVGRPAAAEGTVDPSAAIDLRPDQAVTPWSG